MKPRAGFASFAEVKVRWTRCGWGPRLWSEFDLAKLGGWVVGRNVSEGGWSDVVTLDW